MNIYIRILTALERKHLSELSDILVWVNTERSLIELTTTLLYSTCHRNYTKGRLDASGKLPAKKTPNQWVLSTSEKLRQHHVPISHLIPLKNCPRGTILDWMARNRNWHPEADDRQLGRQVFCISSKVMNLAQEAKHSQELVTLIKSLGIKGKYIPSLDTGYNSCVSK